MGNFKAMEQPRCAAKAVSGISAIENGSFEMLAGFQFVAKIEGIETAGDADEIELILFDGEAPGAGPGERAEPDFAVLFSRGKEGENDWLSSREMANQGLA